MNISTKENKILNYQQFINEMNLNDFLPPGMNIKDFEIGENGDHLSFYSKKLNIFKPVEIKLLRNLSDTMRDRMSEEDILEIEDLIDEDDIEAGTICEMEASPAEINIDYIGHTYYTINEPEDFIENVDFVFI